MPFSLEVGAALLPLSSSLSLGKVGARGCAPLFQVVSTSPLSVALNSPSSVAALAALLSPKSRPGDLPLEVGSSLSLLLLLLLLVMERSAMLLLLALLLS